MESKGHLYGSFMRLNCSKLIRNITSKLSMKYSSLHTTPTIPWLLNGANHPLVALIALIESCCRNHTYWSWRKYRVEYNSELDQQSISGENVSLILCVWKPGYMKSSPILIVLMPVFPWLIPNGRRRYRSTAEIKFLGVWD